MTTQSILTENEENVLLSIINNDYRYFKKTDRALINSATWTFVCEDSGLNGKQISGTISSLTKKGFVFSFQDGNDSTIAITELGFDALQN
jgi:hypothetical protein